MATTTVKEKPATPRNVAKTQTNDNEMFDEVVRLVEAIKNGELSERARSDQFDGQAKLMLEEVNDLIDAFMAPFNVMAEYVDRISKGDIPEPITDEYKGDFNEVNNNLNGLIKALSELIDEATTMVEAAAQGQLDTRADIAKYQGAWQTIVKGLNDTLEGVAVPLRDIGGVLDRMAAGELKARVTNDYKGDYNVLQVACNELGEQLQGVQETFDEIHAAIGDGKLDARGDAGRFKGEIAGMVTGVNDLIDAFMAPFNMMAEYVDRISKGDIPEPITDEYKGDFNEVKNNLNGLIKALDELIDEAATMVEAAAQGQLDARADITKYQGVWQTIVKGLNDTLEGVAVPLRDVGRVLDKMAERDLTDRVTADYKGEYAALKDSLNRAVINVEEAISQVGEAVDQVTSASTQISSGSQSLAEGANEQASALEEISSSLEEMASMTQQNADNAKQANTLAAEASNSAAKGNEAMQRMADAINKIKAASDETAKIVKTIDEIAFQTNLLALNAAVEAARAGDAGKGFAVVAEEVRNLAQRSAEAAKNTADKIEDSVKKSEGGVQIGEEVAKILDEIVEGNSKVNDLIAEIAAASGEQSKGIEQVNIAVAELNKVTQQNAANSEESASAAEELNGQAEELAAMVGTFVLSNGNGRSRRRGNVVARKPAPQLQHAQHPAAHAGTGSQQKTGKVVNPEQVIPLDDTEIEDF